MKVSESLKELVMSLKDRVCVLDQGLIIDPKSTFNYKIVRQEIDIILALIDMELTYRKRRKK